MATTTAAQAGTRPVATWVSLPDDAGHPRLTLIWTVPYPLEAQLADLARSV